MKIINNEEFDNTSTELPQILKNDVVEIATEDEMQDLIKQMDDPMTPKKELAAKIKHYIDIIMDRDIMQTGRISDSTRRWIDTYNGMLDGLQRAIFGDRSVNIHVHKISHADISAKIREATE